MDKNKNDNSNQQTKDMLKEKTNEDFNKQKPNQNDPNQNKNHSIGDEDLEIKRREVIAETTFGLQSEDDGKVDSQHKSTEVSDKVFSSSNEISDEEYVKNEKKEQISDSVRDEKRIEKKDSIK